MDPKKSDQPAPRAGDKAKATDQDEQVTPHAPKPKDAVRPESKPQGTLHDQVKTMESEGQSQPQADEVPPEERPRKGIPPLPEPNVEGVGEESGPSAGKTDEKGEELSPEAEKMAKDASGF
jgi:hypothetical protein